MKDKYTYIKICEGFKEKMIIYRNRLADAIKIINSKTFKIKAFNKTKKLTYKTIRRHERKTKK